MMGAESYWIDKYPRQVLCWVKTGFLSTQMSNKAQMRLFIVPRHLKRHRNKEDRIHMPFMQT